MGDDSSEEWQFMGEDTENVKSRHKKPRNTDCSRALWERSRQPYTVSLLPVSIRISRGHHKKEGGGGRLTG